MFETIIPRSEGGTTRRIRVSTFATSSSVTESRVPLGALRASGLGYLSDTVVTVPTSAPFWRTMLLPSVSSVPTPL